MSVFIIVHVYRFYIIIHYTGTFIHLPLQCQSINFCYFDLCCSAQPLLSLANNRINAFVLKGKSPDFLWLSNSLYQAWVYHIESIFEGIIQWITVWQTLTLVLVETEVKWSKYSDGCKGKMFLKNIIYLFIVSSSSIAAYWDWLQVLLSAWIVLSLIISKEQMQIHNLLLLAQ